MKRGKGGCQIKSDLVVKGGSFLIEDISYDRVFTPEDFNDEQKMIAKTTEEFIINEVLPQVEYLEKHEFDRSVALLHQAGELGLLAQIFQKNMVVLDLIK